MKHKSGFSLVEVVVSVSLFSFLIGLAFLLLPVSYKNMAQQEKITVTEQAQTLLSNFLKRDWQNALPVLPVFMEMPFQANHQKKIWPFLIGSQSKSKHPFASLIMLKNTLVLPAYISHDFNWADIKIVEGEFRKFTPSTVLAYERFQPVVAVTVEQETLLPLALQKIDGQGIAFLNNLDARSDRQSFGLYRVKRLPCSQNMQKMSTKPLFCFSFSEPYDEIAPALDDVFLLKDWLSPQTPRRINLNTKKLQPFHFHEHFMSFLTANGYSLQKEQWRKELSENRFTRLTENFDSSFLWENTQIHFVNLVEYRVVKNGKNKISIFRREVSDWSQMSDPNKFATLVSDWPDRQVFIDFNLGRPRFVNSSQVLNGLKLPLPTSSVEPILPTNEDWLKIFQYQNFAQQNKFDSIALPGVRQSEDAFLRQFQTPGHELEPLRLEAAENPVIYQDIRLPALSLKPPASFQNASLPFRVSFISALNLPQLIKSKWLKFKVDLVLLVEEGTVNQTQLQYLQGDAFKVDLNSLLVNSDWDVQVGAVAVQANQTVAKKYQPISLEEGISSDKVETLSLFFKGLNGANSNTSTATSSSASAASTSANLPLFETLQWLQTQLPTVDNLGQGATGTMRFRARPQYQADNADARYDQVLRVVLNLTQTPAQETSLTRQQIQNNLAKTNLIVFNASSASNVIFNSAYQKNEPDFLPQIETGQIDQLFTQFNSFLKKFIDFYDDLVPARVRLLNQTRIDETLKTIEPYLDASKITIQVLRDQAGLKNDQDIFSSIYWAQTVSESFYDLLRGFLFDQVQIARNFNPDLGQVSAQTIALLQAQLARLQINVPFSLNLMLSDAQCVLVQIWVEGCSRFEFDSEFGEMMQAEINPPYAYKSVPKVPGVCALQRNKNQDIFQFERSYLYQLESFNAYSSQQLSTSTNRRLSCGL